MDSATKSRCTELITMTEFDRFLSPVEYKKLRRWVNDKFVSHSTTLKWCTKAGCTWVLQYEDGDNIDVACKCGTRFCFKCTLEPHQPTPCDLAKEWCGFNLDAEALSQQWINSMTKGCPKCGTRIEKNRACNHMKCKLCSYDFCWQCSGPMSRTGKDHPSWYECNVRTQKEKANDISDEEKKMLEDNKIRSNMRTYERRIADFEKDSASAETLLTEIDKQEAAFKIDLSWMRSLVKDVIHSSAFLKWCTVFDYFMKESGKKENFLNLLSKLETKTDGLLHDMEKLLMDQTLLAAFLNCSPSDKRKVNMQRSGQLLKKYVSSMKTVADEITAGLGYNAVQSTQSWGCLRCPNVCTSMDARVCNKCKACRKHGDFECLVLGCK